MILEPPSRVVSGPEAIRLMEHERRVRDRKTKYPYEWVTPPDEAIRVHVKGSIAPPAANTETQVISYTIPANMRFWLTAIVQLLVGGAANNPGDGQIAWNTTVDIPVGVTSLQGYYVQGLSESLSAGSGNFPMGNFQGGINSPWQLAKAERIKEASTIRQTVTVNNTVSAGGGRFVGMFEGWLVPL